MFRKKAEARLSGAEVTFGFGHEKLILIQHVPKTAGSALTADLENVLKKNNILKKCSPFSGVLWDPKVAYDTIISLFSSNKPTCNFASYEFTYKAWELIPAKLKEHILLLTIVRDPYSHAISAFTHMMRRRRNPRTITSWIQRSKTENLLYFPQSMQTRFLGEGLEGVHQLLWHDAFWVGSTEFYREGFCVLQYQLQILKDFCGCLDDARILRRFSRTCTSKQCSSFKMSVEEVRELDGILKSDFATYSIGTVRHYNDLRVISRKEQCKEDKIGIMHSPSVIPLVGNIED